MLAPAIVVLFYVAFVSGIVLWIPYCDNFVSPMSFTTGAVIVVFYILHAVTSIPEKRIRIPVPGRAGVYILLWMISVIVSVFFSKNIWYSLGQMMPVVLITSAYLIFLATGANEKSRSLLLLRIIGIAGFIFAATGIAQYYGYHVYGIMSRFSYAYDLHLRVISFFGNSNILCEFLALSIMPAAYFVIRSRENILSRAFFAVVVVADVYTIILSDSRSAIIATIAGFTFMGARFVLDRFGKNAFRVVLAAILVLFCGGLFTIISSGTVSKTNSIKMRVIYWDMALEMAADNPAGSGPGTFRLRYYDYLKEFFEVDRGNEIERVVTREKPRHPHNEYLANLSESGVPALLFFLLLILKGISNSWNGGIYQDNDSLPWGAAVFAYAVLAFFGSPTLIPVTAVTFAIALAAAERPFGDEPGCSFQINLPSTQKYAGALLILVVISAGAWIIQRQYHTLESRIALTDAKRQLRDNDLADAELSARTAIALSPDSGEAYFTLGVVQLKSGHVSSAIESFEEAGEVSSDINLEMNKSLAHYAAGEVDTALAILLEVEKALPGESRIKRLAAKYYIETGNYESALEKYYEVVKYGDSGEVQQVQPLIDQIEAMGFRVRNKK